MAINDISFPVEMEKLPKAHALVASLCSKARVTYYLGCEFLTVLHAGRPVLSEAFSLEVALLLGLRGDLLGTGGLRVGVLLLRRLEDVLGRIVVQHGTQSADLERIKDMSLFATHRERA